MYFNETKINTNESARQNNKFKDLDLDFIPHPASSDIVKKTGINAIKRSLRNILLLKRGEIPFMPDKGAGIYHYLFEPFSPAIAQLINKEITSVIKAYEPRVNVTEVRIKETSDKNGIDINIFFDVENFNEPYILNLFLARVR